MPDEQILISVIIPTRNRAHILPSVIEALQGQEFPRDRFEILVVDDGSSDATGAYLQTLGSVVRSFQQDHKGASCARNLAAEHARGAILAFTDDDCRPEKDWLRVIHTALQEHSYGVGLLGHTYSEFPAETFIHSVFKEEEPVVTCNFAVPREAFAKVGGFDPHFELYFEDEDLGLRLKKAGYPIVYEPAMRVEHPSRYQTFRGFLRMRRAFGYFCYMSQKHPEADHWHRHRGVLAQIAKRSALFAVPLLGGLIWHPLWALLIPLLLAHFLVDGWRAWNHRLALAKKGYRLRAIDFWAFTLANWTVPFIDTWHIAKGIVRDWRKAR